MTQQGPYEYKLEIGALSSETDDIFWISGSLAGARNQKQQLTLQLKRTSDALGIDVDNDVRLWRREVGDGSYGNSWFCGFVKRVTFGDKAVSVTCYSYLGKVESRKVHRKTWGNTHVADKEYAVTVDHTGSRESRRVYCDLDAGLPAQDPLEACRVLNCKEFVNRGSSVTTYNVFDNGGGDDREVAQKFRAREGILRKVWLKGYKRSGTTVALTIALQAGDIEPDGTDITTVTFAAGNVPTGSGSEAWFEIDLLNNVADPKKLNLITGQIYWIVVRMSGVDVGMDYYFRCAADDEGPMGPRLAKSRYGGGAWTLSPSQRCMFYGCDFEGDWWTIDKNEYLVQGELDPPRVFFEKLNTLAGDGLGQGDFRGASFGIIYSGQMSARVTYWKGKVTYGNILADWARTFASDIFDTLDISITEPANKQFCIHLENAGGLDALKIIRQFCPVVVRFYEDTGGNVVLEIRDELLAETADWNLYTATKKENRSFRHGFDTLADSTVRIISSILFKEMVSESKTTSVVDGRGNTVGVTGSGSMTLGASMIVGGVGGSFGDGIGIAAGGYNLIKTVRTGGRVKLAGVVQSFDEGVLKHANELLRLKNTKVGLDAIYAVQSYRWSFGPSGTKVDVVLTDTVYEIIIPGGTASGNLDVPDNAFITRLKAQLSPIDGRIKGVGTEGVPAGCSDAPYHAPNFGGGGFAPELKDQPVFCRDDAYSYDNTKYYYCRVGDGVPAGAALGNQLADVLAKVLVADVGGAQKAVIIARISEADFGLDASWPMNITEMGLGVAASIGAARTDALAKSVGDDASTFDVFMPEPDMDRDRSVTVIFTVDVP